MENFKFYAPTKVYFGKNEEKNVGKILKGYHPKKVLIHYGGNSAIKSGLLDRVKKALEEENIAYCLCGGVVANPLLSKVNEGIELCKKEEVDFILAVGGGSVLDSSKGIAYGVYNEGNVWDYYARKKKVKGALPMGCILTLSANGETLDADRTQVAQDELETTNEIAENNADNSNFNSSNLDQAIVEIKQELAEIKQNQGSAATAEQVEQVVQDALNKFNLSDIISQDDIDKLIAFAKKYQNTSAIDSQEVLDQLNKLSGSLKNQLSGLFNKAQSEGWLDKIINFIKSLFN